MTYETWKISDAKARLSEVVGACQEEPQLLYNRGRPVAAIIAMDRFKAFEHFQKASERPSMTSLLNDLDELNQEEADFGEDPPRKNRPQPQLD